MKKGILRTFKILAIFSFVASFPLFCTDYPEPNLTIEIPMQDGSTLPTDLYFPKDIETPAPCVLLRNPSGRKAEPWLPLTALTNYGYLVAIQDTRSAHDPEGKTLPYLDDGWDFNRDGYDTVEWLARSPYTNGKIGTAGFSAVGITQLMMAPTAPPSLKCQYIGQAVSSMYHHGIFPGGQLRKNQFEGWLRLNAKDSGVMMYISSQPFYNEFWKKFDTLAVVDQVQVPALLYVGWYDCFLQGTIDAFKARQENGGAKARGKQKLLIGPWTHFWPRSQALGDFTVPETGNTFPDDLSPKRWFDHYLKDVDTDVDSIAPVTYYVMGPFDGSRSSGNVWRHAEQWPVPAQETSFYLQAENVLAESSSPKQSQFHYKYDPQNPIPTIGGHNLFLDQGPKDQRPIESREDIILFTTQPLKEDLEVTGSLRAKIYFSTDQADTDVAVRLCDVYPDGKSVLISDGLSRLAVTKGAQSNVPFKKPQEIEVDLWSTSFVFAKGHRIRVSVSSSNYPRYEKNHNLGFFGNHTGTYAIARNTVHVGGKTPSRIILPIVRRGSLWYLTDKKDSS